MTLRLIRCLIRSLTACAVLFAACSYSLAQGIPCSYEVAAVIQAPDGPISESPTYATAISPNGDYVLGRFRFDAVGEDAPFFWSRATGFVALPLPPGFYAATPADITDDRVMCGTGWISGVGQRGYVYDMNSGVFTLLPPLPGGAWSGATGINSSHVVSGWRSIGSKGDPVSPQTACILSVQTGITDLGLIDGMSSRATEIADDGMVAVLKGVGLGGYFWDGRRLTNLGWLPGADDIRLWDMQSGARAAGGSLFIVGGSFWVVPFVYQNHALHPLPTMSEALPSCTASAMNSAGLVVGHCRPINNGNPTHAVAWLGDEIRALQPLLIDATNITLRSADALAADGRIVANASMNGGSVAVILVPHMGVPGDTNCDRAVNIDDLLNVIRLWGPGVSFGDLNGDQVVNIADLLIVIDGWSGKRGAT